MAGEPITQIVSKVFGTPAQGQAWLEQDAGGHQHVRCTKCGLREFSPGMAPGLFRLRAHAVQECGLPDESHEP